MAKANYSKAVFIAKGNVVEAMTYEEYLNEYWADETTSPRGVESRRQVCSVKVDVETDEVLDYSINDRDGFSAYREEGVDVLWAVYTWGGSGRGPLRIDSELFDTEREAEEEVLRGMEHDHNNISGDAPACYDTEEEAEEAVKEAMKASWEDVIVWEAVSALDIEALNEIDAVLKEKGVL